jgi:hypothetical protein
VPVQRPTSKECAREMAERSRRREKVAVP